MGDRRDGHFERQSCVAFEVDHELLISLHCDWRVEQPDRMDVSVRHLQGPTCVDVGRFDGALVEWFPMRGVG